MPKPSSYVKILIQHVQMQSSGAKVTGEQQSFTLEVHNKTTEEVRDMVVKAVQSQQNSDDFMSGFGVFTDNTKP